MADEYTPTTGQVRAAASRSLGGDWFDRWLIAHEAKVLSAHRPEPAPVADERVEKITRHVRKISHYEGITAGQGQVLLAAADLIEELARRPEVGDIVTMPNGEEYLVTRTVTEPVTPETDQRILAWERIVWHPAFKPCFRDGKLIDHMMKRLDDLVELEATVNELAPAPVTPETETGTLRADLKTLRDWAITETGWDSGAFERVLAAAERSAPETETEWENPRKGVTHSGDDVLAELLDVAVTALGAYEHLTGHTGGSLRSLDRHIIGVAARAGVLTQGADRG